MRMKLLKIVVVLLLSGSGDARPQRTEESTQAQPSKANPGQWRTSSGVHSVREDSSAQPNETQRHLKDLQHIDQSLRTVATQLLNVSNPEEPSKILDNVIKKSNVNQKPIERNEATPIKETAANNGHSVGTGFGRPVNSKFSYFEASHPGQAMAITEEELEREMSSTRLMTAYKNHPTTTGGISTWILLNPPSTTVKTLENEKKTKLPVEAEVKMTVKPTTLMERIETTERVIEKATIPVSTTLVTDEPSTSKKTVFVTTKKTTEFKPEKTQSTEKVDAPQNTTLKASQTTTSNLESREVTASTIKKIQVVRTTPKPKIATMKTTVLNKPSLSKTSRPNQQNRLKSPVRRTTVKPDIVKHENISTAKIEKVTFRPVQMITIPKNKIESTEKPMFVTKIKASILMDTQKATTQTSVSSTSSLEPTTISKPATISNEVTEVSVKPKPIGTKVNNVLKVQLKKPIEDTTKIEVDQIKVHAPVLKAEKVEKEETKKVEAEKEAETLDNTRIDLMKFDFNPELTKINVDTESSSTSTTQASTTTSTTKRPRHNSKRKKNKGRRRKPAISTSTTTISPTTPAPTENDLLADEAMAENGIQESKIVPETKVATNWTKTKKKPANTPISMQIYNFLSREVMPSFGVMSLVGLGLGLASYFLYPFGGTVTRRNYEVEPKYKYNFDEYGGNYGQSEEEVLSKVLQGMTIDENKYPGSKDYDNNYYKYQHYDGAYEPQTTKKNDQRYPSSSPMYRPENTASVLKYRNTDYRYSDTSSTPNYYDRPKHSEYVVGQAVPGSANRQFVVGSVPKDYPPYQEKLPAVSTSGNLANGYEPTESAQIQFDHDINQNFNFPVGSVQNYGQVQTARPEETYEEVEITPTAVAVEHGPRSLKTKRSSPGLVELLTANTHHSRRKRDSVIQVIPSKRELEEEEKEEDLSNEILNIIDSAIPEEGYDNVNKKKIRGNHEEEFEVKRRKEKEEEKTRLKESTMKGHTLETSTASSADTSTVSSTTKETIESSPSSSGSTEEDPEGNTTTSSKTTEQSSVEWIDLTTKKPTEQNGFNLFSFVKKIAEIKFRLGLTLLKHASEGFARYLGHVQKRINGEE
ncbi:PREDICTED: uncharacterized protein LOC108577150 [Habropoda laboriosa]|uniref:uncharacterized protein LOC108577150 n=1 Tax=Habropoda laboriosa TaxID=597456 RepID=UPI00083D19FB|nr:PREDICTED: uncharacterized protein LOC108577150 [Habropoda laboriosa]